jgi:hypothetical protein
MKKILAFAAVMGLAAGFAGCTKCSPEKVKEMVSTGGGDAAIAVDVIGQTLAPAICGKYESCNKDNPQFNKEQCLQEISAGIAENLKTSPDLKVSGDALEACKKSITDAPCEALNSESPPTGCEFLK